MRCSKLNAAFAAISLLACDGSDCSRIASSLCQGIIWLQKVYEAADAKSHVLRLKVMLLISFCKGSDSLACLPAANRNQRLSRSVSTTDNLTSRQRGWPANFETFALSLHAQPRYSTTQKAAVHAAQWKRLHAQQ